MQKKKRDEQKKKRKTEIETFSMFVVAFGEEEKNAAKMRTPFFARHPLFFMQKIGNFGGETRNHFP